MLNLRIAVLSCIAVMNMPSAARADAFTIDEWFLSTGVSYNSGQEGEFSNVVQNPFDHTHFASMGDSTAASQFQFAWADQFGAFLIEATHQAEGVPSSLLFSSSSGFIWITPTVDLSLTIEAAYSYVLPADPMMARLNVSVIQDGDPVILFLENEQAHTSDPSTPPTGTLTIEGDVILPAGQTWVIGYRMQLFTWGDTVGHMATGSGFVDFQITPEPTTLCLLALGALGLLKRKRSRAC